MKRTLLPMLIAAALATPASAALVAEWRLDEGSGTTTYDSVSSTASDTVNATWTSGVNSPAVTIDGTTGQAFGLNRNSTDLGINGSGAKTIVTWFKTTNSGAAPGQTIWGWSPTNGSTPLADLRFKTQSGTLRFEFNSGAATSSISVADGNWHMAAMIIEAGDSPNTTQFALDGIFVTTNGNSSTTINTSGPSTFTEMYIGQAGNNTAPFNGSIDSVGIFNDALSATDVAILNGLGRIGNNYMSDLTAAATLWTDGGTATINGVTWEKVTGLTGALGDWDGPGANGIGSYIVLDAANGGGIQIIPEPTVALLAGVGLLGLLRRRRA